MQEYLVEIIDYIYGVLMRFCIEIKWKNYSIIDNI